MRLMTTSRFSRIRWLLPLLVAGALVSLPRFGVAADNTVLNLGLPGEPATLDPHRYNLRIEEAVLGDLFRGLTTFSAEGKIIGAVGITGDTSDNDEKAAVAGIQSVGYTADGG